MPASLKLVHLEENEPVTTSLVIAEKTGVANKNIVELILDHKERFERAGILRFETAKLVNTSDDLINRFETAKTNSGI